MYGRHIDDAAALIVDALKVKAEAISPKLVDALQAFADKDLAARVSESMAPLAQLADKSVVEVFRSLLEGTPLANIDFSRYAKSDSSGEDRG